MTRFAIVIIFSFSLSLMAEESMPHMPILKPKRTITVQENDDFDSKKGFGDEEPNVKMMTLMMVEGSGMEGMDMGGMKMSSNDERQPVDDSLPYEFEVEPTGKTAKVGMNVLDISIRDRTSKKPETGLKIKSQVYMTSMDMGTEEPQVHEVSPGKYRVKAPFAMKGPWAVKLILPQNRQKVLTFDVVQSAH